MHKRSSKDTILSFGGSLTCGFGALPHESYPVQLQELSRIHIINAGYNGATSAEGLKQLPFLLDNTSVKLMILCFGGNDILQKKSMSQLKSNLKSIIEMAKTKK
jgi:lysophospholipase L1-like esterase